ncbi:MAG: UDP-N-acetylglucosamine 1-carboxyvinyltransferase [Acidobacteriota bacterium]|nr:UDP-N-acetylglucosamine 1-carboxyvinyltransferase [Blastocatellia bacterium]MDW8413096.1 UDP-N-acetylglucosamine 1-carboxyvinyltransferase [Acidobacteriota bacterium]
MDKFRIIGRTPLKGQVHVSGAKNSALPCMAAALLSEETVILHNLPYVRDIITMRRLLEDMGCMVLMPERSTLKINASKIAFFEAPYELVKTMRASVLALGPLLARFGRASVSLPGGCAIGQRPIDLHLSGLEALGAKIELRSGNVVAVADRLKGTRIIFEKVTVTGTENLMMAASLAEGITVLENAAREPEVVDLAVLLNRMGARISGAGTSTITIEGVAKLRGAEHTIIPDRIEAGTFIAAAAITGGQLEITGCNPDHLGAVIDKFRQAGLHIERISDVALLVDGNVRLEAVDVATEPFPLFPTDMQAQFMATMTQARGRSVITENIFENRFMHASEMCRMGASINVQGRQAVVDGNRRLTGAKVQASDLRASASLVLAALAADGETIIDRVYHIDRGYDRIEEKLRSCGAQIERFRE